MTLAIHTLKPAHGSKHSKKKVGRGNASGHGNYSGHGGKGQTARSGSTKGLAIRSFKRQMQSTPKLGGFRSIHVKPAVLVLSDLEKNFNAGDVVTVAVLREKKMIKTNDLSAKVVNSGKLTKKLVLEGVKCTVSVAEQIKKLGGEVK